MTKPREKRGANNIWLTPPEALAPVRAYAPIGLDPCTEPSNPTGARVFWSEKDDGLTRSWGGYGLVFVNPPYSIAEDQGATEPPMRTWCRKIHEEARRGVVVIALLPCGARYSTGYFQEHALCAEARAVCWWRGRVKFIDARTGKPGKGNLYDSQYLGYGVNVERFGAAFSKHGVTFALKRHRAGVYDGFI